MNTLNPTSTLSGPLLFNDENRNTTHLKSIKQGGTATTHKDQLVTKQSNLVQKPSHNTKKLSDRSQAPQQQQQILGSKNQNNNNNNNKKNNSNKRKLNATKPLSFEVFQEFEAQQEQHTQKKRRLSVDSVDLVQESVVQDSSQDTTSPFACSNDIVSWRQSIVDDYEQRLIQMQHDHKSALENQTSLYNALEEKFKVREGEASYFSFMFDASADQVKELEGTVTELNAKIGKMHKTQVTIAKQLGTKQAQIVSLQKENVQLKEKVTELQTAASNEQVDDLGIILREQIISKKTDEIGELVFRNELLMQQIADLKKKAQKREEEFEKQSKEWNTIVSSVKEQMESGLKLSMQKIAELQNELDQKNKL